MARLPIPGGDKDNWGNLLNEFLLSTHEADGTLKDGAVTEAKLDAATRYKLNAVGSGNGTVADGSISTVKLQDGTVTNAKIAVGAAIDQSKIADLTTDLANKAAATHTHSAADIVSGTLNAARLGSGAASNVTFLRGDGTWAVPSGTGGGVPTTYALGRVKYETGWPSSRPVGYAFIDWIKSSPTDPDPSSDILITGDTITDWS